MKRLIRMIIIVCLLSTCLSACANNAEQPNNEKSTISIIEEPVHVASTQPSKQSRTSVNSREEIDFGNVDKKTNICDTKDVTSVGFDYKKYLSTLDVNNINSINLAVSKFNTIKSEQMVLNDDLYRQFYEFYFKMINALNLSQENLEKISIKDQQANGLIVISGEGGPYIHEKSNFIKSVFYSSVTEGVQKFIDISDKATSLMGNGYIFEDALLTMSWNDLSDLIIIFENYINDYPSYKIEVEKAKRSLNFFVIIYTQYLDTETFAYMSGKSDNEHELRDSYERFLKIYSDSKFYPIFKGYFEIINNNGFKFDEQAKKYLIKNGIEVN